MEIIKSGFKEACGKIYLECSECGCGFAAADEDISVYDEDIYTRWEVHCPCCGVIKTTYSYEYNKLHAMLIDMLRCRRSNEKLGQTAKSSEESNE